jgi:hypothetical protein
VKFTVKVSLSLRDYNTNPRYGISPAIPAPQKSYSYLGVLYRVGPCRLQGQKGRLRMECTIIPNQPCQAWDCITTATDRPASAWDGQRCCSDSTAQCTSLFRTSTLRTSNARPARSGNIYYSLRTPSFSVPSLLQGASLVPYSFPCQSLRQRK